MKVLSNKWKAVEFSENSGSSYRLADKKPQVEAV